MKTPPLSHRPAPVYAALLALLTAFPAGSAHASDIVKADNSTALNDGASWVGGELPTTADYATFDKTVTTPLTVDLGATIDTFGGLKVIDPAGDINITQSKDSRRLTLGPASSTATYTVIDMSAATHDLTITNGILRLGSNISATAVFNIASGRTLTLNTASFTNQTGSRTAQFTGGGNAIIGGIIGGTGVNLAVTADNASVTLNNTAYNAAAARVVSATNGGSLNIGNDNALVGNVTHSISLDDGKLTAANGARSLVNNVALAAGGGTIGGSDNLTLSGIVSGAGQLTKTDSGTLVLSGLNTYTGGTVVNQGIVAYAQSFTITGANGFSIDGAASAPVAGADYGQIQATGGTFTYDGTLEFNFTGTVAGTHTYDLFDFDGATQAGAFTGVSVTGTYVASLQNNGGVWTGSDGDVTFSFSEATGDLTVTGSAIPEPAACAALIGLAGLAFAAHRRRKAAR